MIEVSPCGSGRMDEREHGRFETVGDMTESFSLDQARAALTRLRPVIDEFTAVRADVAELAAAVHGGTPSALGGLPELKAAQARLDELVSLIVQSRADVKGIAPLLIDFPSRLDGQDVLLCWLEGEDDLGWYHRVDLGFAGRRRLT